MIKQDKYILVDDDLFNKQRIKTLQDLNLTKNLTFDTLPNTTGVAYYDGKYLAYQTDENGVIRYPMKFDGLEVDGFDLALCEARMKYDALLVRLGVFMDMEIHPDAGLYFDDNDNIVIVCYDDMENRMEYKFESYPEAFKKLKEIYRDYLSSIGMSIKDFKGQNSKNRIRKY